MHTLNSNPLNIMLHYKIGILLSSVILCFVLDYLVRKKSGGAISTDYAPVWFFLVVALGVMFQGVLQKATVSERLPWWVVVVLSYNLVSTGILSYTAWYIRNRTGKPLGIFPVLGLAFLHTGVLAMLIVLSSHFVTVTA